jgi:hypothetical protein
MFSKNSLSLDIDDSHSKDLSQSNISLIFWEIFFN